jgi:hypothetical protein
LAGLLLSFGPCPRVDAAATTPNPGLKYYYTAATAPVVDVEADVVIYGGTPGGVISAAQTVRMGKSVVLVAFGRHVGGMTSGGLTETDAVDSLVQGGITREFFNATGNTGFKPSKAEQTFEAMLANPVPAATWDPPVPTYYEQRLAAVDKVGARIVAIHMENGSVFRGKMFIDCTYEGDLLAKAGVSYTYGRESSSQYGESMAGKKGAVKLTGVDPYVVAGSSASGLVYGVVNELIGTTGSADTYLQAYNFRMYTAQSSNPANYKPLFQPADYDSTRFEILYRLHKAGGNTGMTVGNDINNHEMFDTACSTDHIGGNRWPDGSESSIAWPEADYATRELIYQSHVGWQLGMLWYLKNDTRYRALATDPSLSSTIRSNIQSLLNKVDQLGLGLGEYPETGGWPHELYVREARRMVSDVVVTQANFDRTIIASDSVGLANYTADSHYVRRMLGANGTLWAEGNTGGSSSSTWRIPYGALIPKKPECENLLVPWAISISHVAFCSMRMEPCFMVLSQSAATAAALCIDRNEAVQDLPYAQLKLQLLADGQILGSDPPAVGTETIVDNAAATGFSTSGTWTASSATSGYYGGNYLHDINSAGGKSATFTPTLSATDTYEVFARWTADPNRATNAMYEIVHAGGTNTVSVNQRNNGGIWYSLGVFTFNAGTSGNVTLRNTAANGYVIADAVRFLQVTSSQVAGQRVHVLASAPRADEAGGIPGNFKFVRDNDYISQALIVNFTVTGSATAGIDYTALPTQVTIPAGSRSFALSVSPIPNTTAQGTRSVVLTLTPDASYIVGSNNTATVNLHDKPYDAWRANNFPFPNAAGTDPGGDPDADGLVNRMEFFLGVSPLSGSMLLPSARRSIQGEQEILSLEFRRQGLARGEPYQVWFSRSLQPGSWTQVTTPPETLSYDPATGDRTLRTSVDVSGLNQGFLRLVLP